MLERSPSSDSPPLSDSSSDGLEAIDQEILSLLAQRFALARTAGEGAWQDEDERRASLSAIRRKAFEMGVPVSLVVDFWDRLADASEAVSKQTKRP